MSRNGHCLRAWFLPDWRDMAPTARSLRLALPVVSLCLALEGSAFVLSFAYDSRELPQPITRTNVFNVIRNFEFVIEVDAPLAAGMSYSDPALVGVFYNVYGVLDEPTPSGFPAFNLLRTIGGAEFYAQGSSFDFSINASADLSDGLQVAELDSFTFNGREIGTGRFHPALVVLHNDGTGSLQNSNNVPVDQPPPDGVTVDFGEEYIVTLSFDPATLTIAIPEPAAAALLGGLSLALVALRRRPRR